MRRTGARADAARLEAVVQVSREIAALHARMCELVAACDPGEDDALREELCCALRLSPFAADQLMVTARELARRLPVTRDALRRGTITYEHARRLASGLLPLPDAAVPRVEAGLVAAAAEVTPARLTRLVERAVIAAGPAEAQRAEQHAAARRDVTVFPAAHGMAVLVADLPAVAAQEVMLALDAAADRRAPGDERSRGQRRADALHAWAQAALASGALPTRHGRAVTVQVTMSLASLLGASEAPAELAGHGAITAATARRLAADAAWRAALTDAAGRVVAVSRGSYRPGPELRDLILARYPTCVFPHCERPAAACDIDHRTPFAAGGPTEPGNLAPLCRRHHRLKTHGGWATRLDADDGAITWTSPSGRDYRVPA